MEMTKDELIQSLKEEFDDAEIGLMTDNEDGVGYHYVASLPVSDLIKMLEE